MTASDSTAPPTGAEPEPHFVCDDVTCVGPHILDTVAGRMYAEKLGIERGVHRV